MCPSARSYCASVRRTSRAARKQTSAAFSHWPSWRLILRRVTWVSIYLSVSLCLCLSVSAYVFTTVCTSASGVCLPACHRVFWGGLRGHYIVVLVCCTVGQKKLFHIKEYLCPKEIQDKGLSPILHAMEVADFSNPAEEALLKHLTNVSASVNETLGSRYTSAVWLLDAAGEACYLFLICVLVCFLNVFCVILIRFFEGFLCPSSGSWKSVLLGSSSSLVCVADGSWGKLLACSYMAVLLFFTSCV